MSKAHWDDKKFPAREDKKFPFKAEITHRFRKWLDVEDSEIDEALVDLTGDTYFEMRKLISQCLLEIENLIIEGKYCGYENRKELTTEQKERIKEVKEDLKEFLRTTIESTWRAILNKQKIGIDKLSISLKPYLKQIDEGKDEENSL